MHHFRHSHSLLRIYLRGSKPALYTQSALYFHLPPSFEICFAPVECFLVFYLFNAVLITAERGPVNYLCGAIDVVRSMPRTVGVISRYATNTTTNEFRPLLDILCCASNVRGPGRNACWFLLNSFRYFCRNFNKTGNYRIVSVRTFQHTGPLISVPHFSSCCIRKGKETHTDVVKLS